MRLNSKNSNLQIRSRIGILQIEMREVHSSLTDRYCDCDCVASCFVVDYCCQYSAYVEHYLTLRAVDSFVNQLFDFTFAVTSFGLFNYLFKFIIKLGFEISLEFKLTAFDFDAHLWVTNVATTNHAPDSYATKAPDSTVIILG